MAGIKELLNSSGQLNNLNKTESQKKVSNKKGQDEKVAAGKKAGAKDNAHISQAARELLTLKLEAKQHLESVKEAKTLNEKDIQTIKSKIESGHYFDDKVIDEIVRKLVDLHNYVNPK